jgi:hypothetical protein
LPSEGGCIIAAIKCGDSILERPGNGGSNKQPHQETAAFKHLLIIRMIQPHKQKIMKLRFGGIGLSPAMRRKVA